MVTNLIVSVVVGIATAILTTYLTFKRFRAEKLWERKVDAYTRLINAAHEMKRTRDLEILTNGNVNKDYSSQLWRESHEAKRTILQLADSASFLITPEIDIATASLAKRLDEALEADSWRDIILKEQAALTTYLECLKDVARRELRS
jgi:hypothetical protein